MSDVLTSAQSGHFNDDCRCRSAGKSSPNGCVFECASQRYRAHTVDSDEARRVIAVCCMVSTSVMAMARGTT
jgi:hypothetical protein